MLEQLRCSSQRRGAEVVAQAGRGKADAVKAAGASQVIDRNDNPADVLGAESVDVVADLVAGPSWPNLLDVMKRGGRYITAGAIAGPMVELDVRTLYLKDLTLMGSTFQDKVCFENLISYIEKVRSNRWWLPFPSMRLAKLKRCSLIKILWARLS